MSNSTTSAPPADATFAAPSPPPKQRSPNYPAINLEEAITRLKMIYEKQRRYGTTREVIVKLMGYKSLNGASATVVSALSKYGLLEGQGDQMRVSELGENLALHRKGDPEYTEALRTAALSPAFFRELHDQYPVSLPHEHALRVALTRRGFTSKAIDAAVRAYRDTNEFVVAETGESVAESQGLAPDEVLTQTQPRGESVKRPLPATASNAQFRWQLYEDIVAEVTFSGGEPTPDDIDLLAEYLGTMKKARSRAKRVEAPIQPSHANDMLQEPGEE